MTQIIIFNGPPGSGKDFACSYLKEHYPNVIHVSFKEKLIDLTCRFYGVSRGGWDERYNILTTQDLGRSFFRLKDVPWEKLGYLSQREALIHVSENVIKPVFGKAVFGELLCVTIEGMKQQVRDSVFVCSDGGFPEEVGPLGYLFWQHDTNTPGVTVARITRDGCSFVGDSRNYLPDNHNWYNVTDIHNDGTDNFIKAVDDLYEQTVEGCNEIHGQ